MLLVAKRCNVSAMIRQSHTQNHLQHAIIFLDTGLRWYDGVAGHWTHIDPIYAGR